MTIGEGLSALGACLVLSVLIWSLFGMPYWVMKHRNDKHAEMAIAAMENGIETMEWTPK